MPPHKFIGFPLDDKTINKVADIVGVERVVCVEEAILLYLCKKKLYSEKINISEMNKTFKEMQYHISVLLNFLKDDALREYMLTISAEFFRDEGGKHLLSDGLIFLNRTPQYKATDSLENLYNVCEASIKKQKTGKGRPTGAKTQANHVLLNALCKCCEAASGGPITTKPGNKLERLVKVFLKPLGFAEGTFSGLIKTTIKTRNKNNK